MKIDVAKDDLQDFRDLMWEARSKYSRQPVPNERMILCATKMIKKANLALKKLYGHDCNGDSYI